MKIHLRQVNTYLSILDLLNLRLVLGTKICGFPTEMWVILLRDITTKIPVHAFIGGIICTLCPPQKKFLLKIHNFPIDSALIY